MSNTIDMWNEYIREVKGKPAGWCWFEVTAHCPPRDDVPPGMCRFRGGIPTIAKSGRKKWGPKKECDVVWVVSAEFDAWQEAYCRERDECVKCLGKGIEFVGWSRIGGERTQTCRKCNGSGKYVGTREKVTT